MVRVAVNPSSTFAFVAAMTLACHSQIRSAPTADDPRFAEQLRGNCPALRLSHLGPKTVLVYGTGADSTAHRSLEGGSPLGSVSLAWMGGQSIDWDGSLSRGLDVDSGGWIRGSASLWGRWPDAAFLILTRGEPISGASGVGIERSAYRWSKDRWQVVELATGGSPRDAMRVVEFHDRILVVSATNVGIAATPLDDGSAGFTLAEALCPPKTEPFIGDATARGDAVFIAAACVEHLKVATSRVRPFVLRWEPIAGKWNRFDTETELSPPALFVTSTDENHAWLGVAVIDPPRVVAIGEKEQPITATDLHGELTSLSSRDGADLWLTAGGELWHGGAGSLHRVDFNHRSFEAISVDASAGETFVFGRDGEERVLLRDGLDEDARHYRCDVRQPAAVSILAE